MNKTVIFCGIMNVKTIFSSPIRRDKNRVAPSIGHFDTDFWRWIKLFVPSIWPLLFPITYLGDSSIAYYYLSSSTKCDGYFEWITWWNWSKRYCTRNEANYIQNKASTFTQTPVPIKWINTIFFPSLKCKKCKYLKVKCKERSFFKWLLKKKA